MIDRTVDLGRPFLGAGARLFEQFLHLFYRAYAFLVKTRTVRT